MSKSTILLQQTVNFCSTHNDLLPLAGVGGYKDEPALTLCNDAISDIFTDPNDFKFNRVEMPLMVTCPNRLDQLFAGACVFSLFTTVTGTNTGSSQGWGIGLASQNAISVTSGVVTVITLENHRFNVGDIIYMTGNTKSAYNSVFTDNGTNSSWSGGWTITAIPTPNSFTFVATSGQTNADITGAPGITNFAYATSASLQEMNNNSSPPNVQACTVYRELPVISRVANPEKVSVLADFGNGILKLRYSWVPSTTTWGVRIVYQATPPLKVSLTDTWAPIPDSFQALFNQALLYRMYRYLGSAQADSEFKKFEAEIAKTQAADDAETTDVNLQPESLLDNSYYGWW